MALLACQPEAPKPEGLDATSLPAMQQPIDPTQADAATRAALEILNRHPWPTTDKTNVKPHHWLAFRQTYAPNGQTPQHVMVLASRPTEHTCHVCSSQISLFAWSVPAGQAPQLLAHAVYVETMGSWGEPPETNLRPLPQGSFQINLKDSYMAQGVEDTRELGFRPRHGTFVEVYRQETQVNHNECSPSPETDCENEKHTNPEQRP